MIEPNAPTTTDAVSHYSSIRGQLAPEEPEAPPFAALGRLRSLRLALDVTITELIGRLQPYVEDTTARAEVREAPKDSMPGDSPLERTINSEALFIAELNERLRELMTDLRL